MIENLTLNNNEDAKTWYPNSIGQLETHLSILIIENEHFTKEKSKGIRKNVSYSLQYMIWLH